MGSEQICILTVRKKACKRMRILKYELSVHHQYGTYDMNNIHYIYFRCSYGSLDRFY